MAESRSASDSRSTHRRHPFPDAHRRRSGPRTRRRPRHLLAIVRVVPRFLVRDVSGVLRRRSLGAGLGADLRRHPFRLPRHRRRLTRRPRRAQGHVHRLGAAAGRNGGGEPMTAVASKSGSPADQLPLFDRLPAEHLFDMYVDLQPAQLISTAVGTRLTFIARGGVIDGPRLRGEILPGGGDWLLVGTDQVGRIDVRATLRTHDAALIHYETRGVIKIPADGLERLAAGEVLGFEQTYVRTTPKFETADERYTWLNEIVAVGDNVLSHDHIDYRIYRVL